jgi:hypothetical protein
MRTMRTWQWMLYLAMALAFGGLLVWATRGLLASNPERAATTELGPYGLVKIRFSVVPFPALSTGPVTLSFMPMDVRGRPVALDGLRFEYGRAGSEQTLGVADATPMTDGSGMYMSSVQLPTAGTWWLRVQLNKGTAQGVVRFTFEVSSS